MTNAFLIEKLAIALTASQIFIAPNTVKTEFDQVKDEKEIVRILNAGCKHFLDVSFTELAKKVPSPSLQRAAETKNYDLEKPLQELDEVFKAMGDESPFPPGFTISDVLEIYRYVCKGKPTDKVDLVKLVAFYNDALKDLDKEPSPFSKKLGEATFVTDQFGKRYTELYKDSDRRKWVPLAKIPKILQQAVIATEDKNFFDHRGVDENGVVRAAMSGLSSGRSQGGSTITQQMIKNVVLNDDYTYKRKMREMVLAARLESVPPQQKRALKERILELYLNRIYFGWASMGVEVAARTYFNKSVTDITLPEAVLLAGIPQNPYAHNPALFPDNATKRAGFVVGEMVKNGFITQEQGQKVLADLPQTLKAVKANGFVSPRERGGFHYRDAFVKELKSYGLDPYSESLNIQATINPQWQQELQMAVLDRAAKFEADSGRAEFTGAERNLATEINKLSEAIAKRPDRFPKTPMWLQVLNRTLVPLYDVHWPIAVVTRVSVKKVNKKDRKTITVGLKDGTEMRLADSAAAQELVLYDVIHVGISQKSKTAFLRFRPLVQAGMLIIENETGKVRASIGGTSYPLKQLDHALSPDVRRQPGSAVKPLTMMAALNAGFQPNTGIIDRPIELTAIGGQGDSFMPRNYGNNQSAVASTLRGTLEGSRNRATTLWLAPIGEPARAADYYPERGMNGDPEKGLQKVIALMKQCGLNYAANGDFKFTEPEFRYPTVIGGWTYGVTMAGMAKCYAAIVNGGRRPEIQLIESVEKDGRAVALPKKVPGTITDADPESIFQTRMLLQGVVANGTLNALGPRLKELIPKGHRLSDYVGGKTGTTQQSRDVWVVGFTREHTIAVWMGYDNGVEDRIVYGDDGKPKRDAKGELILEKPQTLGAGATGGSTAMPLFEAALRTIAKTNPLKPLPPPDANLRLYPVGVLKNTNQLFDLIGSNYKRQANGDYLLPAGYYLEYIRLDRNDQLVDTRNALIPNFDMYIGQNPYMTADTEDLQDPNGYYRNYDSGHPEGDRWRQEEIYRQQQQQLYYRQRPFNPFQAPFGGLFGQPYQQQPYGYQPPPVVDPQIERRSPRQVDPEFRGRGLY